jgi:hypothetical protein
MQIEKKRNAQMHTLLNYGLQDLKLQNIIS